MAVLLVALSVMAILLSMAMPVWRHLVQREREEELIFRGEQYVRAIGLYQQRYASAYPPNIQILLDQKFLRKKYKDPITNDDFQVLYQSTTASPGFTPGAGAPGVGPPGRGGFGPPGRGGFGSPGGGRGSSGESGRGGNTGFTLPELSIGRGQAPAGGQGAPGGPGSAPGIGRGSGPGFALPQLSVGGAQGTLGPQGGVIGVASKSKDASIKRYKGRTQYNEWQFIYAAPAGQGPRPGSPAGPGAPGAPGGPGRGRGSFPPGIQPPPPPQGPGGFQPSSPFNPPPPSPPPPTRPPVL